jgi:hypothetical protein
MLFQLVIRAASGCYEFLLRKVIGGKEISYQEVVKNYPQNLFSYQVNRGRFVEDHTFTAHFARGRKTIEPRTPGLILGAGRIRPTDPSAFSRI